MPALYRHLDDLPERFRGGVVSIGNFDGVHWGHARIVGRLLEMARRQDVRAVILTFDPHPARLLRPQQAPTPLSWTERKARLLDELGVDAVVAYPTDATLLGLTAGEFFDRIILGQLACPRDGRGAKLLLRPRSRRQHRGPRPVLPASGHSLGSGRAGANRRPGGLQFPRADVDFRRSGRRGRPPAHPALPHSRERDSRPGPRQQAGIPDRQHRQNRHPFARRRDLRRPGLDRRPVVCRPR